VKNVSLLLSVVLAGGPLAAADSVKKWKESAQATFVSANGNSKSTTVGASNLFRYDWTHVALELSGQALGSNSGGVVTAEQYAAAEKVQWKVSDRNYAFEKVGWEKNRFAGIANRMDASLGLGRELLKSDRHLLLCELGGGYVNEQRVRALRESFGAGRGYGKYVWTISPTASFSQDAEYLHNFDDPDAYRLNAETALTASVSTHVSLKLSYGLKRVNEPPPGFGKNDTLTSAALIFNY
jgi:putative salt-induced outer membrane protein